MEINEDWILYPDKQNENQEDNKTQVNNEEKNQSTQKEAKSSSSKDGENNKGTRTDPFTEQVDFPIDNKPIVVLFGPQASGKSSILQCLAKYLNGREHIIQPNTTFRRSNSEYRRMCESFMESIQEDSMPATASEDFLLVDVIRNDRVICHILEAPGEHYHSIDGKDTQEISKLPMYMQQLQETPNKKIWIFVLERDWKQGEGNNNQQIQLTREIKRIADDSSNQSQAAIFVCNKVDMHIEGGNRIDYRREKARENLFTELNQIYRLNENSIFDFWKEKRPIIKWFVPYRCSFIPFSSGLVSERNGSKVIRYNRQDTFYPDSLWCTINKEL